MLKGHSLLTRKRLGEALGTKCSRLTLTTKHQFIYPLKSAPQAPAIIVIQRVSIHELKCKQKYKTRANRGRTSS